MAPTTHDKRIWASRAIAGAGALVTAAWLLTYLHATTRQMMVDMALSFLLNLIAVGLLWWAARRSTEARPLWGLLAAGWAANLLGNVTWGVYEFVTGRSLPTPSPVDAVYLARYACVSMALWRYVGSPTRRRWVDPIAVTCAATTVAWMGLFRPTLGSTEITLTHFLDFTMGATYPILDAAPITLGLLAWAHAEQGRSRCVVGLVTLAMISYGAANWLNFASPLSPAAGSDLPGFFWPLADILAGLAAWVVVWRRTPSMGMTARQTALTRWVERVPCLAGLGTAGLTAGDLILRGGRVDPVPITCTAIALGALGYRSWRGQGREEAKHATEG